MSRTDHGVAQTRELQCTKIAVPQAIARGTVPFMYIILCYRVYHNNSGLNVVEVAHDMQHQVSRYVTSDLGLKNSFDTWHGKHGYNNYIVYFSELFFRDQECCKVSPKGYTGSCQRQGSDMVS